MIIPYSDEYKPDVLKLVEKFYEESLGEFTNGLDQNVILEAISKYQDGIYLLVIDGKCEGILAGMTTHFNLDTRKIFQEVMFYINKEHRFRTGGFIREIQRILKAKGYASIVMAYLHNFKSRHLLRFYKHLGYQALETHLIKTF